MEHRSNGQPICWIAEDDEAMRELVAVTMQRAGFQTVTFEDGVTLRRALDEIGKERSEPSLLIVDHHMPGAHGLEVVADLDDSSRFPIIVITAFGDHEIHARAEELGVDRVLDKPFDVGALPNIAASLGLSVS